MAATYRLELRVDAGFVLRLDRRCEAFAGVPRATMIKALVDLADHHWSDEDLVELLLEQTDRQDPEQYRRAYAICNRVVAAGEESE